MSSGTLSHKSFLRSLLEAFGERLNNQAIAGSLALAGASLLSRLAWAALQAASARVKERLFSVYIIPKNTAQYAYFMAWLKVPPPPLTHSLTHSNTQTLTLTYPFPFVLQDQPGVATGVMQVRTHVCSLNTSTHSLTH
jgi:hypothetical protein